jgi:hypothetical protein
MLEIAIVLVVVLLQIYGCAKFMEWVQKNAIDKCIEDLSFSTLTDIPSGSEDNTFTN